MTDWMEQLSAHYSVMKKKYPDDDLIVIFDIDGTIIDMRYIVLYLFQGYDRLHGTRYFRDLTLDSVTATEMDVDKMLRDLNIPEKDQKSILDHFWEHKWDKTTILQSHRPFHGVLEAIRWFTIQPRTFVGLNTGRPEYMREDTLKSLNALGETYRIEFKSEFLFMHPAKTPAEWGWDAKESKINGMNYFIDKGFWIVAFIDNEPENLAVVESVGFDDVLLLHADTFFSSKREKPLLSGKDYDITKLISEESLKERVEFIWHGLYTQEDLDKFLSSNIHWGEIDLRHDPVTRKIIIRDTDILSESRANQGMPLELDYLTDKMISNQRSIKFRVIDSEIIEPLLKFLNKRSIPASSLWFHGNVEQIEEEGFKKLRDKYSDSIISAPINWISPLLVRIPEKAHEILELFASWGINRFSISALTPNKDLFLNKMDEWNYEINIFNVEGLDNFLKSLILLPHSITSTFNFPEWKNYPSPR